MSIFAERAGTQDISLFCGFRHSICLACLAIFRLTGSGPKCETMQLSQEAYASAVNVALW